MNQPTLFDMKSAQTQTAAPREVLPALGKTRTSKAAAIKAAEYAPSIKKRVLAVLAVESLSNEQIAERLKMKPTQVRPRTADLFREGKIHDTGETRDNEDNNPEIIWAIRKETNAKS